MGLMGSLYIGTSGLQTSQNALNTVAHNLANANTPGYTRQQILLSDKQYNTISVNHRAISNQQTGLGVTYAKVRQVRDYFLDQTYRKQSGRTAFYEESYDAIVEVETLLRELDGKAFKESLNNLWVSIQELAKDPGSAVTQGTLVQCASQFISKAGAVSQGLKNYQDNLNLQVAKDVNRINEIGEQIYDLNLQILNIEVGGIESANDLKDTREALLDELSQLVNISYHYDADGCAMVKIEGHTFVNRAMSYEIGMTQDANTGFYTPFWLYDARRTEMADGSTSWDIGGAKVFNLTRTISSELDTDVGGLKAKLLARGDHRANYTDLNPDTYNDLVSQSIIMNIQAEFDNLIHMIVTKINGVLASASDPATGYLMDGADPIRLFQKKADKGYGEDLTPGKEDTLYTTDNIIINPDLVKAPTKLGFTKGEGSKDYDLAKALSEAFDEEAYVLNPNVTSTANFLGYYDNMVSQIGNLGYVFKSIYQYQVATVNSTEESRQQVVGVSDDEELSNMIRFQNAYNASSRYINVIDEMLEHIINTLGV
ncbi:MAG: flagellar hook-associated protein FlgK [Lachnospiraceae bacterium]|nr:flagellar hook-associated protein FlgK [Lachnospiraceae bacterium]